MHNNFIRDLFQITLVREASGRILKIVMLTFFYNPHILKHETLTFEQQS